MALNSFMMGDGVIVSMPTLRVVDHGFVIRLSQTKDCYIGICYFCAKHAALTG
jgi:hypothetical protein